MLHISPPDYIYCPFCAGRLSFREIENQFFKHCVACNWTYYPHVDTSACGVAIKNNQVLLVKRAREPNINTWMFPAGFVSYGEHPEETVIREVKEETGLDAEIVKLLSIEQVDDDHRSQGHFGIYYEVTVTGEITIEDKAENSDIGWFDLTKLPQINWRGHRKIAKILGGKFAQDSDQV